MRRISFVVALLAVVLTTAVVLGPGRLPTGAQGSTPAAGSGFVGSWRLTVSSPGSQPSQSLGTLIADGTFLDSDVPVSPAGGGEPATISSAGHGVWHQTGATTAELTFVELTSDLQGHYVGSVTVSAHLTLGADGNSFSGPFSVTVADPSGKVLFVAMGTVQATRITIQPMASPSAGTPAA